MAQKVSWKKNGPVAAQLFRDIYFGKFKPSTQVAEIHACPNRPYSQLNLNTFYKHVKSTRDGVANYKNLGTGLDNREFVNLVRLNEPPEKEDAGATFEDLGEDLSDEEYTLGEEDTKDEFEDDAFTLESALRNIDINGGIKDVNIPTKRKNPPKKKAQATSPAKMVSYRDPINMVYPDKKRILCLFEADGEVENIADVQRIEIESSRKVCRYTKTPAAKIDALALIGGVVDGSNKEKNEDVANLKAYLEDRRSKVKAKPDGQGDIWELMDELNLEFDCEKQMYDNNGNKIEDFLIDTDGEGLYWCFFWLKGVHATELTPGKKKGRLVGRAAATGSVS